MSMTYPTAAQLRRAAAIRDRIEKLQRELAAILGDQSSTPAAKAAPGRKRFNSRRESGSRSETPASLAWRPGPHCRRRKGALGTGTRQEKARLTTPFGTFHLPQRRADTGWPTPDRWSIGRTPVGRLTEI